MSCNYYRRSKYTFPKVQDSVLILGPFVVIPINTVSDSHAKTGT
jgi:hypothetical protein